MNAVDGIPAEVVGPVVKELTGIDHDLRAPQGLAAARSALQALLASDDPAKVDRTIACILRHSDAPEGAATLPPVALRLVAGPAESEQELGQDLPTRASRRIALRSNSYDIFVLDHVYPHAAAAEQAGRKKLAAFGLYAKLNPFRRPKEDTVMPAGGTLRYEPFWHVAIATGGGARLDEYVDGLGRPIGPAALHSYIQRYRFAAADEQPPVQAILPTVDLPALLRGLAQRLARPGGGAGMAPLVIEKIALYYRPVHAFRYAWTSEDKVGVVEVDGLTGEAIEAGQWFDEGIGDALPRKRHFDAAVASAAGIVPGAAAQPGDSPARRDAGADAPWTTR